MVENKEIGISSAPKTNVVGDAVGVPDQQWFIAIVNNNTEKAAASRLTESGYECYLPTQSVVKVWRNGRKSKQDRVVIPSLIFIHCSESTRRQLVALPYISRFMVDRAKSNSSDSASRIATVSSEEIDRLKFLLGQSDIPVTISTKTYKKGQRVRVIRGSLKGIEGEIINVCQSQSELIIALEQLGCATLMIDNINVEPIN